MLSLTSFLSISFPCAISSTSSSCAYLSIPRFFLCSILIPRTASSIQNLHAHLSFDIPDAYCFFPLTIKRTFHVYMHIYTHQRTYIPPSIPLYSDSLLPFCSSPFSWLKAESDLDFLLLSSSLKVKAKQEQRRKEKTAVYDSEKFKSKKPNPRRKTDFIYALLDLNTHLTPSLAHIFRERALDEASEPSPRSCVFTSIGENNSRSGAFFSFFLFCFATVFCCQRLFLLVHPGNAGQFERMWVCTYIPYIFLKKKKEETDRRDIYIHALHISHLFCTYTPLIYQRKGFSPPICRAM